jgi:hypothetical protein
MRRPCADDTDGHARQRAKADPAERPTIQQHKAESNGLDEQHERLGCPVDEGRICMIFANLIDRATKIKPASAAAARTSVVKNVSQRSANRGIRPPARRLSLRSLIGR